MSSDFTCVKVLDNRLCVTDKLSYAVVKGGQSMTPYVYNAISASPSSLTFNIQTPSEQVVLDRLVRWVSTVTLKFVFAADAVPVGVVPISYGNTEALAPFPLHQLTTVQSISINNNTVSMNTRDVINALLLFNDKRSLARFNSATPTMTDTYGNYSDGVGSVNNALGSYSNVGDYSLPTRGCFVVDEIYGLNGAVHQAQTPSQAGVAQTVYVRFTSAEPILVSPFLFTNPETNAQGIYGVVNMNMVFNIGDCSRVWRSANPWFTPDKCSVSVDNFSNARLIFNQLTPHASDLMPSRNIVPYASFPRYISQYTGAGSSIAQAYSFSNGVYVVPAQISGTTMSSTNIQLNQVPDKAIIFVRKALGNQSPCDSDCFLAIRGISINWNNQSGILSTASTTDLFRYSQESGSRQSWQEFYGVASKANPDPTQGPLLIPTTGSLLCLEFATHINLQEDVLGPGSIGNFQFQFNLQVVNQFVSGPNSLNTGWEIVFIPVLSGLMALERGTCSSYSALLTRQDVLDASAQQAYSGNDVKRMVGGGFFDTLKSVAGKLAPMLPAVAGIAKHGLSMINNPLAQSGSNMLGNMGYGRSGGGTSGGGGSGGRRHKLENKLME